MKKIFIFAIFLSFFSPAAFIQAEEYQCNVSSTRAAGCEPYYEVKHVCPFSQELNEKRTTEMKNGKPTYPEFCKTCGNESEIPSRCQATRISQLTLEHKTETVQDSAEVVTETVNKKVDVTKNSILKNAYGGFKIAVSKTWSWLKIALKGDKFEIKNPSTPVAGVRG